MKKKENKRITEMLDNLENVKHLKFAKEGEMNLVREI